MKKLISSILAILILGTLTACSPTTDSLMNAIEKSDLAEVQKIIKQINVNEKSADGATPIIQAVKKGDFEIVQVLIDAGAKCDVQDIDGNTPLHIAIFEEKNDIIDLLSTREDVWDAKNTSEKTPLNIAEDMENYALLTKLSNSEGSLEDIIKYGELAVKKNPNDILSMNILGEVYFGMAEHAKSIGELDDAKLAAEIAIEYCDKVLVIAPSEKTTIELKENTQLLVNTVNDELALVSAEKKAAEETERITAEVAAQKAAENTAKQNTANNNSSAQNAQNSTNYTPSTQGSDSTTPEVNEPESKTYTYTHVALQGAVIISQDGNTRYSYRKKCESCGNVENGSTSTSGSSGTSTSSFTCTKCKNRQDIRIETTSYAKEN